MPWLSQLLLVLSGLQMLSTKQTLLQQSDALPWRSHLSIVGPVLVVAPHPDDETLGCGGLIALLRQLGQPVQVLVISDGTQSHPRSQKYPAFRLRALRESETLAALATLGVSPTETTFFRLPDGAVPSATSSEFTAAVTRCYQYLRTKSPQTILLPWRLDPHPDHRATWEIVQTAAGQLEDVPRLVEYPIWDWDPEQQGDFANLHRMSGWRLEIAAVLAVKRDAIAAYRSQTTNLIDDDPSGFQLTPEMLANFHRPWELYLEETR